VPVYIRPARVEITEGGGSIAVVIGVIALAAVISGAAALITDLITAILIATAVLVAGSLTVLVVVLRRTGFGVASTLLLPEPPPARAVIHRQPGAIEAPRPVLPGHIVQDATTKETP
jgi:hypothetical protein